MNAREKRSSGRGRITVLTLVLALLAGGWIQGQERDEKAKKDVVIKRFQLVDPSAGPEADLKRMEAELAQRQMEIDEARQRIAEARKKIEEARKKAAGAKPRVIELPVEGGKLRILIAGVDGKPASSQELAKKLEELLGKMMEKRVVVVPPGTERRDPAPARPGVVPRPAAPPVHAAMHRLDSLERKLDEVLREIQALRNELRRGPGQPVGPPGRTGLPGGPGGAPGRPDDPVRESRR